MAEEGDASPEHSLMWPQPVACPPWAGQRVLRWYRGSRAFPRPQTSAFCPSPSTVMCWSSDTMGGKPTRESMTMGVSWEIVACLHMKVWHQMVHSPGLVTRFYPVAQGTLREWSSVGLSWSLETFKPGSRGQSRASLWLSGKEFWRCRRCGFDFWVRKIPWRRPW